MAGYALLAALAGSSLSDRNIRLVTLALLALLAAKTIVHQVRHGESAADEN